MLVEERLQRDAEASASETERKVVIDGDMYITRGSEEY